MCWSHCNLFVNVRPKYLADVTDSSVQNVCPWSWYLASIVFFLLGVLCIYQGGISCTIHFPNVPVYLDLFVGFQHRCYWILSGTLLCRRRRVLLLMLVLIGGRLCSSVRACLRVCVCVLCLSSSCVLCTQYCYFSRLSILDCLLRFSVAFIFNT